MSISFVQQRQELYAADFLVTHNGTMIGQLSLQGKLGSREGTWSGTVLGRAVTMTPGGAQGLRPYSIRVDGNPAGSVAMEEIKSGLLTRTRYHRLDLLNRSYQHYTLGLGKAGTVGCLYSGDTQLAQTDKGITVENALHTYEIFALDQEAAFASILLCCYRYVVGSYQPGQKAIASKSTKVSVTTDKFLKSKYNPNFKATHQTL